MRDLTQEILELVRLTSTNLSPDVEEALQKALAQEEPGTAARGAMETIMTNVEMTRRNSTPICQDTGTPIFFVRSPDGWSPRELGEQIRNAVAHATKMTYLRPNAVDSLNGKNTGNNLGDQHFPTIHFEEINERPLSIELILKGGGCENVGAQYSLPDDRLQAGRDLEGVRKCVLDAVYKAQGEGCAPGFLGVAIGGDRGTSFVASKEALLRKVEDTNPREDLAALEERITKEANQLGIGPMGFGGKSTVLGTKITSTYRLPASFYVTVSYMCWAFRRRRMIVQDDQVKYE
ncbi:MAG TPA: fumarate hydratase [Anaerolineaceae bacterium]|nr:fumarate hydratase [Anaerolineaceae bacterium]